MVIFIDCVLLSVRIQKDVFQELIHSSFHWLVFCLSLLSFLLLISLYPA